jgi:hypothetical protein
MRSKAEAVQPYRLKPRRFDCSVQKGKKVELNSQSAGIWSNLAHRLARLRQWRAGVVGRPRRLSCRNRLLAVARWRMWMQHTFPSLIEIMFVYRVGPMPGLGNPNHPFGMVTSAR